MPFPASTSFVAGPLSVTVRPRARVLIDNDFAGDPDGLFQLAHHLLCPSVEVRGIIASRQYPDGFYGYPGDPAESLTRARELLDLMGLETHVPLVAGAREELRDLETPVPSEAVELIIAEAMREDTNTPLYLACGAGLTEAASAVLREPRIAQKLRLLWIGGPEYAHHAPPPPGAQPVEYNLGIDRRAAQVVFNHSALPLWQIPRNAYRQVLVSLAELERELGGVGDGLGDYLLHRLGELLTRAHGTLGETYVLGDNPLVLLSALQSSWEVDPSSSAYRMEKCPLIDDHGHYRDNPAGRDIRVYTTLDSRLLLADLYAKVRAFRKAR